MVLHNVPVRDSAVIWRALGDELVLVRPTSGEIRVLNAVGAFIWGSIDGRLSIGELAAALGEEYAVSESEAQADAQEFIVQLQNEGWLTLQPNPQSPASR
jgi:hypothetical protein